MGELIFNGGMLIFLLAMTVYSGSIEVWQGYVGARYWPMFLLVCADLIFIAKTVGILRKLPKEERKLDMSFLKEGKTHRLLAAFALTIVYAGVMQILGFFIATIVYAMCLSAILGLRNLVKLFLSSLVITVVIYVIFVWALDIMVPRGAGPLYYFGLWLETLI